MLISKSFNTAFNYILEIDGWKNLNVVAVKTEEELEQIIKLIKNDIETSYQVVTNKYGTSFTIKPVTLTSYFKLTISGPYEPDYGQKFTETFIDGIWDTSNLSNVLESNYE